MPSAYSTRLRLVKQNPGENRNIWGAELNVSAIDRIDDAVAGLVSIALTGDHAITASNTGSEEARYAMLNFTGGAGPFVVTIPNREKIYKAINATSGQVTLTTGSGSNVALSAGDIVEVFCDGTNVKTLGFGGTSLKDYIASVVVGGGASLPSLVGNSGKWLTNNGVTANWANPTVSNISDYASDQATRTAAATARALAFAISL